MSTATPQTVTIDQKHYNTEDLNENAQAQLRNLRFIDEQIQLASNQQVLAETARTVYTRILADNLPSQKAAANKKKDVITINGEKYNLADFSELGKSQLLNIEFADKEMTRLKNQQAILQTARSQYALSLSEELTKLTPVTAQ